MNYTLLPGTGVKISTICLGTMTFGKQNTISEAHSQIDFALNEGINFIDTAEMYPIPAKEETHGSTERIIGSWLKKNGNRHSIVLATKIAGANRGLPYIRKDLRYNAATIRESVEKSLQRLRTDYIDLYQLHWPERKSNMFGQLGFTIREDDAWEDNTHEILECLQQIIKEGKIRNIGVSNETPWGLMRFLEESKKHSLPKVITIQNPYSLVNRTFEIGLTEAVYRENIGLLAYSPLAFGFLTGKYLHAKKDPGARLNLFPNFTRYNAVETREAAVLYGQLAKKHGLSMVELSLAFVNRQPFVTSTLIGATSLSQLEENIRAFSVVLPEEVITGISRIHQAHPNPAP